ncbi:hypothetical protein ACOMCP_00555 [Lactiplantibacillus plantarum]|uniref:Uncharacterized protein n=1 Tax=Lactiplantibacillus plantarum TaxID=1590 RepID=A0A1E3KPD7_LACPN|nr:hypothetical protein [Lactiplantibacillus plantarum]MDN7088101.1 hypothetical protein [Lactiplantibacillus plantarum]ODO60619.1 hypothetical protein LPJSA22_00563 [Lactiplantibacillus plantarum]UVW05586.1 hypothetical protein NX849_13015 [Lactiplantibacillus plantarum]UWF35757.1 hypothetical protein NYR24_13015 [Lactiplantibacillus plantarum]
MSKSDVVQRLLEELNNQNQIYIAIIALVLVFFGVMQWRFSDKQIKKMKDDFKKDFKIEEINSTLKEANRKSEKLNTALLEAKETEVKLLKQLHSLQNQDLDGKLQLLETKSRYTDSVVAINQLRVVERTLIPMFESKIIEPSTLMNILITIANVSISNVEENYSGDKEYQENLNFLVDASIKYTKTVIADKKEFKKNKEKITEKLNKLNEEYSIYKGICVNDSNNQGNK